MKKIIKRISNRIYKERICPQCGEPFIPIDARQIFCCEQHRIDFHNDQRKIKNAPLKKLTARILKNDTILKKIFTLVEEKKAANIINKTLLEYEHYDFEIYYERGINAQTKRIIDWFFYYGLEAADADPKTFIVHKRELNDNTIHTTYA